LHSPERAIAEEFGINAGGGSGDPLRAPGRMALEDHDTAADALLVKAAERKATLLAQCPAQLCGEGDPASAGTPAEVDRSHSKADCFSRRRRSPICWVG
jgi:hypothetical protein